MASSTTLDGAEFTIYEGLADGTGPDTHKVVATISGNAAAQPVLGEGSYWLVETKSPSTYELLAQAVQFKVTGHEKGWSAEILRDQSGLIKAGPSADTPGDTITIQVADVRTGTLPKTGGSGLTTPLSIAGALIAAGFFLARRKA